MNAALYKNGIKGCLKLWLIFFAVMGLYIAVVISMFDPNVGSAMSELTEAMPELMALFGMKEVGSTLVEFMSSYLYGMIFVVFPMVYTIMAANNLVARHVDRGSMAYLLAAPVSRLKMAATQLMVLLTGVVLLTAASAGLGAAVAQAMFPGELDAAAYIQLNLGALLMQLLIAGICYLASCIFNDTKWSLTLGAGLPVLCYVIQMVANLGGKYETIKYATFFSLYSPTAVLNNENWIYGAMVIMAVASVVLYLLAITIFRRKDIPV